MSPSLSLLWASEPEKDDRTLEWCVEHSSRRAADAPDRCLYFIAYIEGQGVEPWCAFEVRELSRPSRDEQKSEPLDPVWL